MSKETEGELRRRIAVTDNGIQTMHDPETGEEWRYRALTATALHYDGLTEHGMTLSISADTPGPDMPFHERLARLSLYHQMNAVGAWRKPIDTTNHYLVGGDSVSILNPSMTGRYTKDNAVALAAWLVMVAAHGETDQFNEILNAIKET